VSTKSNPTTHFHLIWHVATAMNDEHSALKYPTRPTCVHTLPCNITRDKIVLFHVAEQKNSKFKTKTIIFF